MKIRSNKLTQGFTIIEVIIVLAIAGLIMAIVFLAVPNLQRSQRNNARTTDANRIAASIVDWTAANPNKLPDSSATNPDCDAILKNAGSLGSYKFTTCSQTTSTTNFPTPTVDTMNLSKGVITDGASAPAAVSGAVMLVEQGKCNGNSKISTASTSGASSSSIALFYATESGGGYTWSCRDVQ